MISLKTLKSRALRAFVPAHGPITFVFKSRDYHRFLIILRNLLMWPDVAKRLVKNESPPRMIFLGRRTFVLDDLLLLRLQMYL